MTDREVIRELRRGVVVLLVVVLVLMLETWRVRERLDSLEAHRAVDAMLDARR